MSDEKQKTISEIVDSMNEENRNRLYALVGYMLENGVYDFTIWDELIANSDKNQIKYCRAIIEEARKEYKKKHKKGSDTRG